MVDAGGTLVQAANEAGGRDNITVVLARLEEVGGRAPVDATTEGPALATAVAGTTRQDPAAGTARAPRTVPPRGSKERAEAPLPRKVKIMAATLAIIIVVGALGIAGWLASRAVFFVGTNDSGMVTVYRGLPWDLPAGLHLYENYYVSGVPASAMTTGERDRLLDHRLRSRDDVRDLISALELDQLDR
jgi:protein phosphatase